MAEPITMQKLIDASLDSDTLGEFANDDKIVTSRNGREYPSAPMASRLLVENGLLGATPFSTYAAMTGSALLDGDYAVVTNDSDNSKNGFWQKQSSAWVYLKWNPITQFIEELNKYIDTSGDNDSSHVFTDKNGFVIAELLKTGVMNLSGINIKDVSVVHTNEDDIALIDKNGFVIASINNLSNPDLKTFSQNVEVGYQVKNDINAIIMYGQSLSRGQASLPVISTTASSSNLMLSSGVLTRPSDAGYAPSAFVPLKEQVTAAGTEGETPVTAMLEGLSRRATEVGLPSFTFFGGSMGRGGQSVENLSQGTANYSNLMQYMTDAHNIAKSQGKSFNVWSVGWVQGENDNANGSNDRLAYQYTERLLAKLWQPLKQDIVQLTGQKFNPYLVTYQTPGHRRSGIDTMHIAKAQWRASKEHSDIIMAVPAYIFPTASDDQHLTNEGSWLMGEYMSRALFYTMIQHKKWRPLEPIDVDWQDTYVDIKFYVPQGKLVIDNALAATYDNAGFIFRNATDFAVDIISSVEIIGKDTVRINISVPAPAGYRITYGRGKAGDPSKSGNTEGPRGNLRDTHGDNDKVISPLGNEFSLHNPCVYFEYSKKYGFAI